MKTKKTRKQPRTKTTAITNNNVERWVLIPDCHAPFHDERSLAAVEAWMADHRWDGLINLGDFLDFNSISSHNLGNLRAVEGQRLMADYRVADEILERHLRIVRKRNPEARFVYLEGNHEDRVRRYVDANPSLEGMIEPPVVLRLRERGVEWVPSWSEGAVFRLSPKLVCSHGLFCNDHHAKKMVQRFGVSVLYGHTHDVQVYSSHGMGTGNTITGASLGCLCLPQGYMRGQPTRWQQAVSVVEVLPSGDWTLNIIRVCDHRFVYDGVVYAG